MRAVEPGDAMKTMPNKKILATLAGLPLFLTSCMVVDLDWAQGNGIAGTEVRSLSSFNRIRMEAPVHVVIKTGAVAAAVVTTDENLTGYLTTDAWAGTLTIGMSGAIDPTVEPEITITVPELRALTHNGNGLVEIEESGDFPDLDLTLNGAGEIAFSGTADRLHAALNGSGVIDLEGYVEEFSVDLRGDGEVHAENLLAGDADVDLSGSGFVFLDLDYHSTLNLNLTGSGQVEWWGSPAWTNYAISGSGKVIEHRGLPKRSAVSKQSSGAAAKTGTGGYEEVPAKAPKSIPFAKASAKR